MPIGQQMTDANMTRWKIELNAYMAIAHQSCKLVSTSAADVCAKLIKFPGKKDLELNQVLIDL